MGCHFLLQGIFPIQGWNTDLVYCRQILYLLSQQGIPHVKLHIIENKLDIKKSYWYYRERLRQPILEMLGLRSYVPFPLVFLFAAPLWWQFNGPVTFQTVTVLGLIPLWKWKCKKSYLLKSALCIHGTPSAAYGKYLKKIPAKFQKAKQIYHTRVTIYFVFTTIYTACILY